MVPRTGRTSLLGSGPSPFGQREHKDSRAQTIVKSSEVLKICGRNECDLLTSANTAPFIWDKGYSNGCDGLPVKQLQVWRSQALANSELI